MRLPRPVQHGFTLLKLLVVLLVAGVLAAGFVVPYIAGIGFATDKATDKFLTTSCHLTVPALDQSTQMYARDGKTVIARFFADDRKSVRLSTVPQIMRDALIDTEDRRFYHHHGVDVRGLARAALSDSNDGDTQGASTLTQQLVKQIRLYDATAAGNKAAASAATARNADRKIYEAKCALDLENRYSKDQILEDYLNIAYFGEQSYGIYVAAETYFGKTPAQLSVPEAATLAGLVKDPADYDPFQYPKAAQERRNQVINNMADVGSITVKQAAYYEKLPIHLTTKSTSLGAQGCAFAYDKFVRNAGFFCDYALYWLESKTGGNLPEARIQSGGYKIVTSLDANLQNTAENTLFGKFPANSPSTVIQPAVNPQNGQILAMITSKHYDYGNAHDGKNGYTSLPVFNGAFAGSGSTYKYFSIIAALEAGVRDDQKLRTSRTSYKPTHCKDATTAVHNAGNDFPLTMTMRDATVRSSNTYFVGLEDQLFGCDLSTIVKTAQDLGITSLNNIDPVTGTTLAKSIVAQSQYTFTLGQTSTSALQLTQAYGVAANDGIQCDARPILSVTDVTGKPVPFAHSESACRRKLDPWVAATAVDIMKGDTGTSEGTAHKFFAKDYYPDVSRNDHWVAGKTGTNNATKCTKKNGKLECTDDTHNSSLWFVGITPQLAATSAIVNLAASTSDVQLPGVHSTSSATEQYGAYASRYWIDSFKPMLSKTTWHWQVPSQLDNGSNVPVDKIIGEMPEDAVQTIKDAGFVPAQYPINCGSNLISGLVAYAGPPVATLGSTVTFCVSNGQTLNHAPEARPKFIPLPPVKPKLTAAQKKKLANAKKKADARQKRRDAAQKKKDDAARKKAQRDAKKKNNSGGATINLHPNKHKKKH